MDLNKMVNALMEKADEKVNALGKKMDLFNIRLIFSGDFDNEYAVIGISYSSTSPNGFIVLGESDDVFRYWKVFKAFCKNYSTETLPETITCSATPETENAHGIFDLKIA